MFSAESLRVRYYYTAVGIKPGHDHRPRYNTCLRQTCSTVVRRFDKREPDYELNGVIEAMTNTTPKSSGRHLALRLTLRARATGSSCTRAALTYATRV